jgi:hypothetical protein
MQRLNAMTSLVTLTLVAAACSTGAGAPTGGQEPASVTAVAGAPSPAVSGGAPPSAATGGAPPSAAAGALFEASPSTARGLEAWQTVALRDVRTGEPFTIGDLAGSLVVIEPMAIWCSNCLRQQEAASKALAALDSDQIAYVSLDIDPSEAEADLARYADEHGFDWRFAVAPRELSRALAQTFGDQVLSPPSTPRILVTPDGRVIGPAFGMANAQAVQAELRELLP